MFKQRKAMLTKLLHGSLNRYLNTHALAVALNLFDSCGSCGAPICSSYNPLFEQKLVYSVMLWPAWRHLNIRKRLCLLTARASALGGLPYIANFSIGSPVLDSITSVFIFGLRHDRALPRFYYKVHVPLEVCSVAIFYFCFSSLGFRTDKVKVRGMVSKLGEWLILVNDTSQHATTDF